MRIVPIEFVKENDILGRNIYDAEGRVLLKAGMILKYSLIYKLKEMNILSIYITDEYSEEYVHDIISEEIRQKTISTIKKSFKDLKSITLADKYSRKQEKYFENIEFALEEILEELLNNKEAMISLVDIRSLDNYLYSHSVNVAIISLLIGIALGLPRNKLKNLCMGALLHDIGKVLIPKEILDKSDSLTVDEENILKSHAKIGYNYLKDLSGLSSTSKIVALEHHEQLDGKGYPNNLSEDKIFNFSKIVSIADTYDNLCSDTYSRRALCPSDALEYLMSNAGTMFDYEMVRIFCKIVEPFTKGTMVNLSTGEVAVVKETIKNFPLRPVVKIIKSFDEDRIGKTINLIEKISIVIKSVCYKI